MSNWRWFDPAVDTEETAKAKRKRYARIYHPDIVRDDGLTMQQINDEMAALVLYLNTPIPIPVQVAGGTTNPHSYWAAVVGSAKVNVNGGRMPQTGQPAPAQPPRARAAGVAPPSPFPGQGASAPPNYTTAQTYAPPPPPSAAPTPRTRRASVRVPRGTNIAALEQQDYEQALLEPLNAQNLRVFNRVGIIWQDRDRYGAPVVVNDIRVGTYRLQIRVAGVVQEEFPLTRSWKQERQNAIAHAKANYL
jgi:hypothetical protein